MPYLIKSSNRLWYLRDGNLHDNSNDLLFSHENKKLNAKLKKAPLLTIPIQSKFLSYSLVVSRSSNYTLRFEKCDVKHRGVRVCKLKQVHFPGEAVFIGATSWGIFKVC